MIIGIDIRPLMEKNFSGVGFYLLNLLDYLFQIDQKNEYKLFYNSFRKVDLPQWDYPNVKFYGFKYPNKILSFCFQFLHWPKADEMIGGCDVFLIPNLCFITLSGKCKKIITVHDLSFELYKEFFNRKWRLTHWLVSPNKFITGADKLIAVSENTKRDLIERYGLEEKKVEVVYSGMNQEINPPTPRLRRTRNQEINLGKFSLPEEYILTLGTNEPRKNLVGVIQAFEKLKIQNSELKIGLVIAGGSGWLNAKVDQLIKQSKFQDEIKILGYVSEEEKFELYRRAEVFIYPSFYEGFGFPPLEAMSAGCPVITSLSSATAEICGPAAVLVDPYNIEELVEAIKEIISSKFEVQSSDQVQNPKFKVKDYLIERGYQRVKEFNWQRTAEETLKVLTSVGK